MNDRSLVVRNKEETSLMDAKGYFYNKNFIADNVKKVFNKDVRIDKSSIIELNRMINEKLKNHTIEGFLINVDIRYENRKTEHFGSWQEYERYNWGEHSAISSIIIEWKFEVRLPDVKIPHEHFLIVKLSNGLKPGEMLNLIVTGDLSEVSELENNFFPVATQCGFADRVFGNEMINIVEKWVDQISITDYRFKKIMRFIKTNNNKIIHTSKIIMYIAFISITLSLVEYFMRTNIPESLSHISKDDLINYGRSAFILFIIWNIIPKIINATNNIFKASINKYGKTYIFSITNFDKKKIEEMKKNDKYATFNIGLSFFQTIFVAFLGFMKEILIKVLF